MAVRDRSPFGQWVKFLNYCCVKGFIEDTKSEKATDLADRVGCTDTTVRNRRRRVLAGVDSCQNKPNCRQRCKD